MNKKIIAILLIVSIMSSIEMPLFNNAFAGNPVTPACDSCYFKDEVPVACEHYSDPVLGKDLYYTKELAEKWISKFESDNSPILMAVIAGIIITIGAIFNMPSGRDFTQEEKSEFNEDIRTKIRSAADIYSETYKEKSEKEWIGEIKKNMGRYGVIIVYRELPFGRHLAPVGVVRWDSPNISTQ